jgi:hypothetical protein
LRLGWAGLGFAGQGKSTDWQTNGKENYQYFKLFSFELF